MENLEIDHITLHVGQAVEGTVANHISTSKYKVELTLTDVGVRVKGNSTNSLIPFSNIQAIAFKSYDR